MADPLRIIARFKAQAAHMPDYRLDPPDDKDVSWTGAPLQEAVEELAAGLKHAVKPALATAVGLTLEEEGPGGTPTVQVKNVTHTWEGQPKPTSEFDPGKKGLDFGTLKTLTQVSLHVSPSWPGKVEGPSIAKMIETVLEKSFKTFAVGDLEDLGVQDDKKPAIVKVHQTSTGWDVSISASFDISVDSPSRKDLESGRAY